MKVIMTVGNRKQEYTEEHFRCGNPEKDGNYIVISRTGAICRDNYSSDSGWQKSENDGTVEYLPQSWERFNET